MAVNMVRIIVSLLLLRTPLRGSVVVPVGELGLALVRFRAPQRSLYVGPRVPSFLALDRYWAKLARQAAVRYQADT